MNFSLLKARGSLIAVAMLAALTALHGFIVAKTYVVDRDQNIRTLYSGYGDIPLHLTQVNKFARNPINNFDEPIYAGTKLRYPFIVNFISGILTRITGSSRLSFIGPITFLAAANILLAYWIFQRLIKSQWFAALAVLVFLLGSGLGGFPFVNYALKHNLNLKGFVDYLTVNNLSTVTWHDARYFNQNIAFGAPLGLVLVHQRPFFLGMFGFLLVLTIAMLLKTSKQYTKAFIVVGGFIFGALPLAHTHSFVAIALVLGVFLVGTMINPIDRNIFKRILTLALIGSALAIPQLVYLMRSIGAGEGGSFLQFRLGWMVQPTIGSAVFPHGTTPTVFSLAFLNFLWVNFGLFLPAFLGALAIIFVIPHSRHMQHIWPLRYFACAGLILFLAVQLIRFQPWDYDNNKLLVYFQFFASASIMALLHNFILHRRWLGALITLVFLVGVLTSGTIDIIPRVAVSQNDLPVIFDKDAQLLASYIIKNVAPDALILTGDTHLNPITSLAGRSVLVGYPGWLWTRGINYNERLNDLKTFYANPLENKKLTAKYGFAYVLLDGQTIHDYGANPNVFNKNYQKIFEAGPYSLYRIP